MLVVQLFVMKDGAFQGVEMAAGSRIVVGPPTSDVPLEGVADDGVVLTLRGDTLVASTLGSARVNGRAIGDDNRSVEVQPSHDVTIGAYAIKVRRMNASSKNIATNTTQAFAESVTKQSAPSGVAMQALGVREPAVDLPVTELLAMGDTVPEPDVNSAPNEPALTFLALD